MTDANIATRLASELCEAIAVRFADADVGVSAKPTSERGWKLTPAVARQVQFQITIDFANMSGTIDQKTTVCFLNEGLVRY